MGGFDGLRRLRSVERYDPFSNTWASAAPLLEAVSSAAVAPLRRPALRDRGRWAGWRQHQQGGPAEGGGGLLCARSRATSFMALSVFLISSTTLSHPPHISGKEMNSEKGPQGHTVGLDLNVWPGAIWVSKI